MIWWPTSQKGFLTSRLYTLASDLNTSRECVKKNAGIDVCFMKHKDVFIIFVVSQQATVKMSLSLSS